MVMRVKVEYTLELDPKEFPGMTQKEIRELAKEQFDNLTNDLYLRIYEVAEERREGAE
jgi:hypothetical protein